MTYIRSLWKIFFLEKSLYLKYYQGTLFDWPKYFQLLQKTTYFHVTYNLITLFVITWVVRDQPRINWPFYSMKFNAPHEDHRKQMRFISKIISDAFFHDGKNYPFVNRLCIELFKYQWYLSKTKIFISNSTIYFLWENLG